MTPPIPRRTGWSAPGIRRSWRGPYWRRKLVRPGRPLGDLGKLAAAGEILADLLAERLRGAAVEVARHGGTGEHRPVRGEVAPEPAHQPVAQFLAGGGTEYRGHAHALQHRVDSAALRPGLDQPDGALRR